MVVNPEIVSKKAFVKFGIAPVNINGREPKRLNITQLRVTTRKPSFLPKERSGFLDRSVKKMAPPKVIKLERVNIRVSSSLYIRDTGIVKAIKTASSITSLPKTYATTLEFNILLK